MKNNYMRKLSPEKISGKGTGNLKRNLGAFQLTMMGVGVTIGSGIFVITGVAAAEHAGPALVFSFVIAGIACGCAALCYAELASAIPASGGSYTFAYVGLGEIFGWFLGWCLTLEYVVAMSAVAVGWSAYCGNFIDAMGVRISPLLMKGLFDGGIVNLPAVFIVLVMALLQLRGSKETASINNVLVFVKIGTILIFIALVASKVNLENYTPFMPYGWDGVFSGAAIVFFAYIGFDAIANSAEEVKEPQKTMPKGIICSLLIATVLYIAVTFMLTGVVKYYKYSGVAAPVSFALGQAGIRWGAALVSVGAIAGLTTGVLVLLGSESRLIYSMARDGLLPAGLAKVTSRGVPGKAVAAVGLTGCLMAGLLPIESITELCNIGTLWAFFLVAVTVMVLRRMRPKMIRGFRVPLVPWIPLIAMGLCVAMAGQLAAVTWISFGCWAGIGFIIYMGYGAGHSRTR